MGAPCPEYWSKRDGSLNSGNHNFSEWIDCENGEVEQLQRVMDSSKKCTWTRDRGKGVKVPDNYTVVKVKRNENAKIWRKYALKRIMIKEALNVIDEDEAEEDAFKEFPVKTGLAGPLAFMGSDQLDRSCNEWLLWHGTSEEGAKAICNVDFKQSKAGSVTGTLYGPGTYFAESCTKADEYAKEATEGDEAGCHMMLLCRVVGGRVKYTADPEPNAEELVESCQHGRFDSVLGDREKCRNTFKEFVVFGSDQAYPEFIVYYKRNY